MTIEEAQVKNLIDKSEEEFISEIMDQDEIPKFYAFIHKYY